MAFLNINQALYDTILNEKFDVIRRLEVVGPNGVAVMTGTQYSNITGVVTAAHTVMRTSANDVRRNPSYETQTRTITVVTPFFLQGIVQGSSHPDIIIWKGDNYEVKSVNPFPQFGPGFMEVEAISIDYIDLAFVQPGSLKGTMNLATNSSFIGVVQ